MLGWYAAYAGYAVGSLFVAGLVIVLLAPQADD